ncbi:hypothetical protein K493DRAFT_37010 [Basidiobolus meristosporus CBS 931.73]|uniref:SH3 domain-containing protein n=1 Tax=Basidiobolus meristosporus CBS 931.73 TaxID=1314790 RepID=A0A1Y1Z5E8_9FUNG|nr:hypothetical protein K493DRAFT_37010 [Basidiobolus meristosporus CBS 931.73]|eukprot:ORY05522.1 hypothetical protein K493DRAFT_37010 [Basidiobolus meristosporus CBS 931.73]
MYQKFTYQSPFFLFTLVLNLCGFIVSFVSSCALRASGFTWFVIAYLFCLIFGISVATFGGFIKRLRLAFLPLAGIAIMFLVIEIDDTIYSKVTSIVALGTGFVITAIGMIAWIFGLGFEDDTEEQELNYSGEMIEGEASPQMGAVAHGITQRPTGGSTSTTGMGMGFYPPLVQNPSYSYKALAVYSYEASHADPNEISFAKDEVLDIVDTKGKWWQARRSDGTVGIVPSNYLRVI